MRTDSLITEKSSEFRNIFCFLGLLMLKIAEMLHLNAFRRKSASLSGDSLHEYSQASMLLLKTLSPLLHSGPWYHISAERSLVHFFFSDSLCLSYSVYITYLFGRTFVNF